MARTVAVRASAGIRCTPAHHLRSRLGRMDLGVGLPSTIPTATGADVLTWAREADRAGFASVGTLDRVVYGNHETIPTLAAAAAVTSRVRLTTSILIAPFRGNGTLLAKQLATVDSISNGRLTVGIAVGGRADDYTATGTDFDGPGRGLRRPARRVPGGLGRRVPGQRGRDRAEAGAAGRTADADRRHGRGRGPADGVDGRRLDRRRRRGAAVHGRRGPGASGLGRGRPRGGAAARRAWATSRSARMRRTWPPVTCTTTTASSATTRRRSWRAR